ASPVLWIATLFYLPVASRIRIPQSLKINPLASFAIFPLTIFFCVFPAYWGTGILGQHRTLNTAFIFFVIFWFFNLHIIAAHFNLPKFSFTFNKRFLNILSMLLIAVVVFTGNSLTSWCDLLSGKAKEFDRQMTMREEMLQDCVKNGNVNCQ